ncbi:hypothetical protein PIB30_049604 [Stylosanthes scabra]|uniref:Uncharacterized protein n=1 Tax=Stylosanthes scabra TaxID=79078 RepID=A0ABU6WHC9_9FABA|nr:hypothetical protein [Stylosanthes scabra]
MSRRLFESPCTKETHEKWMEQYGKVYKNAEEKERRFQIFKNNVEFIESFNSAGDKSFKLSVNRFADLTVEEFKASLNGLKKSSHWAAGAATAELETASFRYENVTDIPETMDWRERDAVTPIKDQGQECASWWAFSSVAAIEGIHKINTGKLVSLSVQELIDCVRGNSEGCYGGFMEDAYTFVAKNGGITSESNYPYIGVEKTCNPNEKETKHSVAKIKGFEKVPSNDEKALLKAVAKQPVSVYLQSSGYYFQFYSSGIFTGICETGADHAATIVGYGKDIDGTKYWIVKNCWGTQWGEKGYIRMKREVNAKEGLCGIANNATYPII